MQRYRWPGYEMQLLGGLQKQQNNAQFCDTLLQTEGISVPTHSCILAALSPYLSQKLSASPSPPSGQKRQLQLQAVKSQTLLKLVSLLYTGELEVKGSVEQDDVLSAARQFGIRHLVKGQENGQGEGEHQESSCREKEEGKESRKMQDVQVQAEMAGKRDPDSPVERRSCESTSTQTVKADEKTLGGSFTHSAQTKHPSPVHASSGPLDKHCRSTACPHISSMHSEAQSDGESTLDRPADSVAHTTSTSALSSNMMTFPTSLNDDSNSLTPQEDGAHMQCSKCGERLQVLAKEGTGLEDGKTNGKTADDREHGAQPSHSNRDEMIREDKGNSTVKRHAHVGSKSLAKMKQAMKTTQISVKLKKRTEGEAWEVVSMRDADETLSLLTSLTRDGSYHRRPQADLRDREPPPSSVQPETPILQPATTNSIEAPPHLNTTSDSQLPGPAEECDEQIEKLLEDIMMGLNILPNVERDCKKSHYLPPNHDEAPAICQVPVTENERPQSRVPAAVRAAGRVYYQDVGTQIGQSSTNTAQNQPSCSSLSSVQPTSVLTQQQQQQRRRRFPQYHPSVTSMVQRDGRSHQGMSLSKSTKLSIS
ncbi:BTB/POZ domain-containing protein 18-like isoform X3 [Cottoperca gobio]|uniref:BTB/POZ domain-containing protein 18-like isoform X3 n=1 Tax=Cottoperca gobio TaxID=56716 RepID=A0A6J2QD56_COTGO|nr:BTB/POZ domain-containing protein 18 isoform X3 [Cottoperca gobio]